LTINVKGKLRRNLSREDSSDLSPKASVRWRLTIPFNLQLLPLRAARYFGISTGFRLFDLMAHGPVLWP